MFILLYLKNAKSWNFVFLLYKARTACPCTRVTLLVCHSEWPKDKPFLLMHSRDGKNWYDSKIKRIFEIMWTHFEIILFIHFYLLKKAPGQSQKHFIKKSIMDYYLLLASHKYIWPKIVLIFMHGLKSTLLAIFQKAWYGTF